MKNEEFKKRLSLFKSYYSAIKIMQELQQFCKEDMFSDNNIELFFYHEIDCIADDVASGEITSGWYYKRIESLIDSLNDWHFNKKQSEERYQEQEKKKVEDYIKSPEYIFEQSFDK